jgi:hypothetical protein
MLPHLGIDLARLSGNNGPQKGRVIVAVNITAKARPFVFPTKGVIHVRVASRAKMKIGHDRGTLRGQYSGAGNSTSVDYRGIIRCFVGVA